MSLEQLFKPPPQAIACLPAVIPKKSQQLGDVPWFSCWTLLFCLLIHVDSLDVAVSWINTNGLLDIQHESNIYWFMLTCWFIESLCAPQETMKSSDRVHGILQRSSLEAQDRDTSGSILCAKSYLGQAFVSWRVFVFPGCGSCDRVKAALWSIKEKKSDAWCADSRETICRWKINPLPCLITREHKGDLRQLLGSASSFQCPMAWRESYRWVKTSAPRWHQNLASSYEYWFTSFSLIGIDPSFFPTLR